MLFWPNYMIKCRFLFCFKTKIMIVSALYNDTSLIYPEVQSDFNRIMASILVYDSSALPEHRDEIGKKLMEMYFPSGRMDDHTHKNAVEVNFTYIFTIQTLNSFFFFQYSCWAMVLSLHAFLTWPRNYLHRSIYICLITKMNIHLTNCTVDARSHLELVMVTKWSICLIWVISFQMSWIKKTLTFQNLWLIFGLNLLHPSKKNSLRLSFI